LELLKTSLSGVSVLASHPLRTALPHLRRCIPLLFPILPVFSLYFSGQGKAKAAYVFVSAPQKLNSQAPHFLLPHLVNYQGPEIAPDISVKIDPSI
jgi:hypothetical protein